MREDSRYIFFPVFTYDGSLFRDYFVERTLIALNKLRAEHGLRKLITLLDAGYDVLLDSGAFSLASAYMRKHQVSLDVAFSRPPREHDGFDDLFGFYFEILDRFHDRLWGYIEMDMGSTEDKKLLRAEMEKVGYNPIPVFHPGSDSWDYFHELAAQYDRICFGLFSKASRMERVQMLSALAEVRKQYPDLWIHLLGYTPNELLFSYPAIQSSDSSSWISAVSYGEFNATALGASFSRLGDDFRYELGNGASWSRAITLAHVFSRMNYLNVVSYLNELYEYEVLND